MHESFTIRIDHAAIMRRAIAAEKRDAMRSGVASGPWTDDWQGGDESEFAEFVNQALAMEGDTA